MPLAVVPLVTALTTTVFAPDVVAPVKVIESVEDSEPKLYVPPPPAALTVAAAAKVPSSNVIVPEAPTTPLKSTEVTVLLPVVEAVVSVEPGALLAFVLMLPAADRANAPGVVIVNDFMLWL